MIYLFLVMIYLFLSTLLAGVEILAETTPAPPIPMPATLSMPDLDAVIAGLTAGPTGNNNNNLGPSGLTGGIASAHSEAVCAGRDATGNVRRVWRVDFRPPDEIRQQGGFYPREWAQGDDASGQQVSLLAHTRASLLAHVNGMPGDAFRAPSGSGFVSVTCSPCAARSYAVTSFTPTADRIWIYEVAPTCDTVNVAVTLGADYPADYRQESEYANLGPITWDRIRSYRGYGFIEYSANEAESSLDDLETEISDANPDYDAERYALSVANEGEAFLNDALPTETCVEVGTDADADADDDDQNNMDNHIGAMEAMTAQDSAGWDADRSGSSSETNGPTEPRRKKLKTGHRRPTHGSELRRKKKHITAASCADFQPNTYGWLRRMVHAMHWDQSLTLVRNVRIQLGNAETAPRWERCLSGRELRGRRPWGEATLEYCNADDPEQMWTYNPRTRRIEHAHRHLCLAVDVERLGTATTATGGQKDIDVSDLRIVGRPCYGNKTASSHISGDEDRWTRWMSNGLLAPDFSVRTSRRGSARRIFLLPASGNVYSQRMRFTSRPDVKNPVVLWQFRETDPKYW